MRAECRPHSKTSQSDTHRRARRPATAHFCIHCRWRQEMPGYVGSLSSSLPIAARCQREWAGGGAWVIQTQAGEWVVTRPPLCPQPSRRLTLGEAHHSPKLLIRKKLLAQLRGRQGHLGLGKDRGSWRPVPPMLSGALPVPSNVVRQDRCPPRPGAPGFLLRAFYM